MARSTEKMFFMQGDLLTPIKTGEEFDMILFNAPYLPSDDTEGSLWLERAWAGGPSGRKTIDNFIHEAPNFLKPHGQILLMQSSLSDIEATAQKFQEAGLDTKIIASKQLPFFETVTLVMARYGRKEKSSETV
jgi:release factor glutamine methyltransferase